MLHGLHDQQHSPSSNGVRFNARGFDFPPVYVDLHNVPPSPTGSTYTGDTGALATADRTPHPLDILMGPARPALSFIPTAQHTYRRTVQQLFRRQRCQLCTPLLCRHHTSPSWSHCSTSAMQSLALPSSSPPWPPTPRCHGVKDAAHDALLQSAHANALIITTYKQYSACAHGISAIVEDPLRWWRSQREHWPNLYHLACDVLCILGL